MSAAPEQTKKVRQITVKMEPGLHERFARACTIQEHREGQLARILIEWALPFYENARSVEGLRSFETDIVKSQTETERRVFEGASPSARKTKQKHS